MLKQTSDRTHALSLQELRQDGKYCRGQLITGCVPVAGVDKCFPGDFSQGAEDCAQTSGGYSMTTFASLLSAGKGADGKEGSLCDPKVSLLPIL